jgi:glyoxylase-like metal-dependent hydrolase (beta-lactamase superfamily II)
MSKDEEQPTFYVCETIREGQLFHAEGATLRAVLSPGHTSDHCAFVLEQECAGCWDGCV